VPIAAGIYATIVSPLLILFIIFYNFFESLWFRTFDVLWVVFVILVAEAGRYWQPLTVAAKYESSPSRARTLFPSRWARTPPPLPQS
jgi:hypothetical protein